MALGIMAAGLTVMGGLLAIDITGTGGIMDIGTTDIEKFMFMAITDMGAVILVKGGGAALVVEHM